MFSTIITALDPQTYGLNRTAVALGLCALGFMVVVGMKLLAVLHQVGLPSAS